jgi:hypothetical protein
MNVNDYYAKIPLLNQSVILNEVHKELRFAIDNGKFVKSIFGMTRYDCSEGIRNLVSKSIQFDLDDVGILVNEPNSIYPPHIDAIRQSAINTLLVKANNKFKTYIYESTVEGPKVAVPYVRNVPFLINTSKLHSVHNESRTDTRYVFSIGLRGSFESTRDRLLALPFL